MAQSAFGITTRTEDTWNRWSVCSVDEIVTHVRRFGGCLQNGCVSDDAFYDQLCRGARGSNQFDADYQCKAANKVQSSEACGPSVTVTTGKVPAQVCWDDFLISCTNSQGSCSDDVFTIFDGTPCIGADSNTDYVCYRGDCLEKVDVCAGRNTTTVQPVTTNAPATDPPTTNAPTTDPPTTNAPATDPLTTNAPATGPPTTNAPATDPPTTLAPTTELPGTTAPSCVCAFEGRRQRRCCRRRKNLDMSCCSGCKLNKRGNCRPVQRG